MVAGASVAGGAVVAGASVVGASVAAVVSPPVSPHAAATIANAAKSATNVRGFRMNRFKAFPPRLCLFVSTELVSRG